MPIGEHHQVKTLLRAVLGGGDLACARCGNVWVGGTGEVTAAREANEAWEKNTATWGGSQAAAGLSRSEWEAKKVAEERAKLKRLKEGRW